MNFEDERYVRVYTRKTVTARLLGWEGRMCLHALLLEVDRAGVLDLEGMEPAEALAALADLPLEHARAGMARILDRGVAIVAGGRLFLPRFIEAQEARQSDAQRQRESRARRVAELRCSAGAAQRVTIRDHIESQDVTDSHTQSHDVTVGHSVLCSAVLSSEDPPVVPHPGDTPKLEVKVTRKRPRSALPQDWQPTPEHQAKAQDLGLSCSKEAEKFRAHADATGRLMANWNAAFTTWLLHAQDFVRGRPPTPPGLELHNQYERERGKAIAAKLFGSKS